MNLELVSVESRRKHRQSYLPGFEESTTYSPPQPNVDPGNRTEDAPKFNNPEIIRILKSISDRCLCGYDYVNQYLRDLYRRNCRPNTIRGNGTTIILFLTFLKSIGHIDSKISVGKTSALSSSMSKIGACRRIPSAHGCGH